MDPHSASRFICWHLWSISIKKKRIKNPRRGRPGDALSEKGLTDEQHAVVNLALMIILIRSRRKAYSSARLGFRDYQKLDPEGVLRKAKVRNRPLDGFKCISCRYLGTFCFRLDQSSGAAPQFHLYGFRNFKILVGR